MPPSSRRDFLRIGLAGAAAGLAAACTSAQTSPVAPVTSAPESNAMSTGGTLETAGATATAGTAGATATAGTTSASPQASASSPAASTTAKAQRTLVVVQLSGGHDGLNAVVPYGNGLYYQLRPQIGVPADQVLHLDDQVGLHPNLKSFKTLFDTHQLAIIQGVGYPNASRSHFRSMEIWHTAQPQGMAPSQGWLGAFMSEVYKVGDSPFECVNFGASVPQALLTQHAPVAAMQDTANFSFLVDRRLPSMKDPLLKRFGQVFAKPAQKTPALDRVATGLDTTKRGVDVLAGISDKYQPATQYPNNAFGKTLQQVSQMLTADIGTRVFYVQ